MHALLIKSKLGYHIENFQQIKAIELFEPECNKCYNLCTWEYSNFYYIITIFQSHHIEQQDQNQRAYEHIKNNKETES